MKDNLQRYTSGGKAHDETSNPLLSNYPGEDIKVKTFQATEITVQSRQSYLCRFQEPNRCPVILPRQISNPSDMEGFVWFEKACNPLYQAGLGLVNAYRRIERLLPPVRGLSSSFGVPVLVHSSHPHDIPFP